MSEPVCRHCHLDRSCHFDHPTDDGIVRLACPIQDNDAEKLTVFNVDETEQSTPADPLCERCGRPKSEHRETVTSGYIVCTYHPLTCPGQPAGGMSFRRRTADMPRIGIAPHPDVPLGAYVHSKSGNRYEVIGGVYDATGEGDTVKVLYRSMAEGYLAERTVEDWTARVKVDGELGLVPRFRKVEDSRR